MLCKMISGLRQVHEDFFSAMRANIGFSNTQMPWFQNWDVGSGADWKQRLSKHIASREWLGVPGRRLLVPSEAIQQWKRFQGWQLWGTRWSLWIACTSCRATFYRGQKNILRSLPLGEAVKCWKQDPAMGWGRSKLKPAYLCWIGFCCFEFSWLKKLFF